MNTYVYTRVFNLRNVVCAVNNGNIYNRLYATMLTVDKNRCHIEDEEPNKFGRAMQMYLQKAREQDEVIKKEIVEYEIGKRHLAKMMGEDPNSFTQADIDRSIQYLFPSGLFESSARPFMKHPKEIFSASKAAEFDESGRPFNSMFYTGRPNYYQALHKIVDELNSLDKFGDNQTGIQATSKLQNKMDATGSTWLTKEELKKLLLEPISDSEHEYFIATLERLLNHSYSSYASKVIMRYRKNLAVQSKKTELLPIQYDNNGVPYVTVAKCQKKTSIGQVTIWGNGSGTIVINGTDILNFTDVHSREQIIFPLIFTKLSDKVDVEATITGGGASSQAAAIRWGISWALRSFVNEHMLEKMRMAGLLTRDWRRRERKKCGQKGARRKFAWNKR